VAYNIIKKHNGSIDVKNEVGKGTTFTIRLPGGSKDNIEGAKPALCCYKY
jgi:signal transduction histidine kinase